MTIQTRDSKHTIKYRGYAIVMQVTSSVTLYARKLAENGKEDAYSPTIWTAGGELHNLTRCGITDCVNQAREAIDEHLNAIKRTNDRDYIKWNELVAGFRAHCDHEDNLMAPPAQDY